MTDGVWIRQDGVWVGADVIVGPQEFDPLTAFDWEVVAWASDPAWTPPADGAAVASWPDRSGNGRDLVQADAGKRPLFDADGIGGMPCLVADGVDDTLATALISPEIAQPLTLVAVCTAPGSIGG